MTNTVREVDHGAKRWEQAMKAPRHPIMRVGVLNPDADVIGVHDIRLGDLALIHELGEGVPTRPFLRSWFDALRSIFVDDLMEVYQRAHFIDRQGDPLVKEAAYLKTLGIEYADSLRESILNNDAGLDPNAQLTIDRKGFDLPLIETGQLVDAIRSEIEK